MIRYRLPQCPHCSTQLYKRYQTWFCTKCGFRETSVSLELIDVEDIYKDNFKVYNGLSL